MKKTLFFLILFLPAALMGQRVSPYAQQFWKQIKQTCSEGTLRWEKSIEEVGENAVHGTETHIYQIDCETVSILRTDADAPEDIPSLEEFHYLFEYNCYNPYIKDYFDLNEEKGVVAILKPEYKEDTPLQKQVFETSSDGTLLYAEAHVLKENMLYDLEVKVRVWFSKNGNYERHEIDTFTRPALKDGVKTQIKAYLRP